MKIIFQAAIIILFTASFQLKPAKNKTLSLKAKIEKRNIDTFFMRVTLTNNSPDTIRYITWDCSWEDVYSVNSDRWAIVKNHLCFANGHVEIQIPPYQSETKFLELMKTKGFTKTKSLKFKVGFNFMTNINLKKNSSDFTFPKREHGIIWSNEISPSYFNKSTPLRS